MREVIQVNPFRCCVWERHGRMEEYVTESSCKDEMASMRESGQLIPAIGRRVHTDSRYDVEIICGARRLFAARQLNIDLTVEIRDLNEREAAITLDIENNQRRDFSAYERGRTFTRWLASGAFSSQEDLARALKTSSSQVSRLIKVAKLPSIIVGAFESPADICEMWGLDLYAACEDADCRRKIIERARALSAKERRLRPRDVFEQLTLDRSLNAVRQRQTLEVVVGQTGSALFKIRYDGPVVRLMIDKQRVSGVLLDRIKRALTEILQDATLQVSVESADTGDKPDDTMVPWAVAAAARATAPTSTCDAEVV